MVLRDRVARPTLLFGFILFSPGLIIMPGAADVGNSIIPGTAPRTLPKKAFGALGDADAATHMFASTFQPGAVRHWGSYSVGRLFSFCERKDQGTVRPL